MVRISEITEVIAGKEEKISDGAVNGDGLQEETQKSEKLEELEQNSSAYAPSENPNSSPGPEPPALQSVVDPAVAAEKTPYNEYALRVAYIMRSYIQMNHINAATASNADGTAAESAVEGCGAVMEIVRMTNGRWTVARFVLEHTHALSPPPDPAGTLAGVIPVVGMEFESISMAKAFYQTYSEKMGFKCKTGAGKRSKDNRTLVMQRFYCSKGSYPPSKRQQLDAQELEKKQRPVCMPYRKIAPKPSKDGEVVVVVPDDSPKEAALAAGNEQAASSGAEMADDEGELGEKDSGKKPAEGGADCRFKEGGKVALVSNPGQSRLLRELGIRVSKYTHEERRDIISKYMKRRNGRQLVDRSVKIPSRQALAERRQRGVGGKFLSKEEMEMQTTNKQEEAMEEEDELPEEDIAKAGGVPIVGMVFENEEKAYQYYVNYAGNIGFSVRKGWWDKTSKSITRSRVYVCSREGFRPKNVESEQKKSRPETRTGCPARMAIKITSSNKYRVTEFVSDHNHQLAAPLDIQFLRSQKMPAKSQVGNNRNPSQIPVEYRNYVRSRRMKEMQKGDAGAVLAYLQKMKGDDPTFYYAIQVDEDDQMANVFWADAKSIMDYHYFGDVLCFDTSYRIFDYGRPFALFLGVNHHKQVIIFGAALLYDESLDSFKWLFETFKMAMSGKQPKTILTEKCATLIDAVTTAWPGTIHCLCLWYLYQDALRHLKHAFRGSENFPHDLSQCLYEYEEEEELVSAWIMMLDKYGLKDNERLVQLFEERKKWASVYGQEIFCGGMENSVRVESMSSLLKEYLSLEKDLPYFFETYEKLLDERRSAEIEADNHAIHSTPRIPPLQVLWQTANAYTPASFDVFRREFDRFMNCIIINCGEIGTLSQYEVALGEKTKGHIVRFDSSTGAISCSCNKFTRDGIQCCHVLKVLDLRNIKELPPQYILKRWRKDAKVETLQENHEFTLDGDLRSSLPQRYSSLCRMLHKIAARASENPEAFALMVSQSDRLIEQVERILQTTFLEKSLQPNSSKALPQKAIESANIQHDIINGPQNTSGRKRKDGVRRRTHDEPEANKRQKDQNVGQPDELEDATMNTEQAMPVNKIPSQPRVPPNQFLAPNHFMQAPYVTDHQFALGTTHGFHAMAQFTQDSPAIPLQQQQFHGGAQLSQAFPTSDLHSLHFVTNNPQMDHQSGDQGHCALPVWDFLRCRYTSFS